MSFCVVSQSFHISTHALREEGDSFGAGLRQHIHISTHALREEGDLHLRGRFGP